MVKTVKEKNNELTQQNKELRHYGMRVRMVNLNKKQVELMHKSFGCARLAFNSYLAERQKVYKETGNTLRGSEFKSNFIKLKNDPNFLFLKEPDKFAIEVGIESVEDAYDRFFKGQNKFPKFKSKHKSEQKYTTKSTNNNIKLDAVNQKVKLPKLGWIRVRFSKKQRQLFQEKGFHGVVKGATISFHNSGQYYVSLKIEEVVDLKKANDWTSVPEDQIIGCDLGLTHFLIDSNGNKIDNPRFLKERLHKLAKLQRQLKNKKIGSFNYKKLQKKVAKLHLRIANMRKDFLHQQSRKLVNENQVIVLEDLNVKGMIKNKKLARSIADVSWSMFKTFVSYKADWDNKKVVLVNRFFASSKLCNDCKEKNTLLSLNEREWVCPKCGTIHDRDKNAANNIKEEGIRLLKEVS